jgi:hypothetical protein
MEVGPPSITIDNVQSTPIVIFLYMNDDPLGTDPYTFSWLNTTGGALQAFTAASVTDPNDLMPGQYFIEERLNPIYDPPTTHTVNFKAFSSAGSYRFFVTNNIGRMNSINHPPADGTTPTALIFTIEPPPIFTAPLRTFPVTTAQGMTRVVVMPENPKVQKYPAIAFDDTDPRYRLYVRDSLKGDEFIPYAEIPGGPPEEKNAPWVRAYLADPYVGGIFDPGAPFFASTALKECVEYDPSNTANWVSDWGIREWNRVFIETTSNTIFPPQANPDDVYYLVVFGLPADWIDPDPVGVSTFHKIDAPAPFDDIPEIIGIADADLVFDAERDGVPPMDSDDPILEYSVGTGVAFDWSDLVRRDYFTLFVLANYLHPDVFFGTNPSGTQYRDNCLILYSDSAGNNLLGRTTSNQTVTQEVYVSTVKPYKAGTNPGGYIPPTLPGEGDPPVAYDDNDTGWMVFPLAEIDRFSMLLDFYQTFYVGVGIWNPLAKAWVDTPAPLVEPFTVTNYT